MLMTTKNGKAIAKVIAIAICALMLVACFASCSDDTAARLDEAYNAALKAEEAAKDANQAAKDAQNSADNALAEAEKAESLAGTKLTEEEIVKLLEKYVDSDELATELAKLLSEESVKALVAGDITAAKKAVMDEVKALLDQYGCPELADEITEVANGIVDAYAEAMEDAKADALEALLALIETKNAKLAEVKVSLAYGEAAADAIREAFEIAQVKILCANTANDITAANDEFAAVLEDLPSIVDELFARAAALKGKVIIAVPGYYADSSLDEIKALEAIVTLVNNDATLADLKAEMEEYGEEEIDLTAEVEAIRGEYTALETAFAAAGTVNTAINKLEGYNTLKYTAVVAADGLAAKVAAAQTAVEGWINANFATDKDNANINRILYNRVKYLNDRTPGENNVADKFSEDFSAAEYAEYVANLPVKYTAAINALVGTVQGADPAPATKWDNGAGYVLAGDLEALAALKTNAEAENITFEFAGQADYAAAKTVLDNAWNYAAYADYLKTAYNADGSAVKAAVEALVALNGKLTITDVNATENNKFTAYETAYAAWIVLDPANDATFTEVVLKAETVTDIVGADNEVAIEAVYARKAVLEAAEDAAEKINLGGTYTYYVKATEFVAGTTYYTFDGSAYTVATVADEAAFEAGEYYVATEIKGGEGIDQYFNIADGVWTLKTTLTYRDIVELRRLAEVRDLWATTFAIELDVADNYDMVKNAELAEATAAAKVLVDAIINNEYTQALMTAVANLNKVSANGADYANLYSYILVNKAIEACTAWENEFDDGAINTTGIKEFEDAGLNNISGTLAIIHSQALAVYEDAKVAFNETLYTEFDADFTVEGYKPTIYDKFVRDAWKNANDWVNAYLNDADFGSAEGLYNIDDLDGILTSALYAKVKAAYEKYDAYVDGAVNELTAIDNKVAAFKNGNEYKVNLVTDKKVTTVDIPAEYAAWAEKYLDEDAVVANADVTVTYGATATEVKALSDAYTKKAADAKTAWDADVASLVAALENYEANIYSSADPAEALNKARTAYTSWATTYLAGTSSAVFANMPADDAQLAIYKNAIVAIEGLEAEVAVLVKAYTDERDAIIAEINDLPAIITSADAADVATIRDRYDDWATDYRSSVDNLTNVIFYNQALDNALKTLVAAEDTLEDIKDAYEAVVGALALPTAPQNIAVNNVDALVSGGAFDTAANTYVNAVKALKTAVDAYLEANNMTAVAAGTVAGYDLTADQVKAITTAYALAAQDEDDNYVTIAAIKIAHELFFEYQNELEDTDYTDEEKLNRAQALATTKDVLIKNIVADAEAGVAGDASRVERIGRTRMAAILAASGTTAEPELDDTWEDLENWGGSNPI